MKNLDPKWRLPLIEAALICLFILGLFTYWFAVANRYSIFLYGHIADGIPRAQPFDPMTASRYWMSGLVATGAVMVLYVMANWLRGRLAAHHQRQFVPSDWWRVWLLCALPITICVPAITMTLNWPTLPAPLALACVVATLFGLALALLPGRWAAIRPVDLMWLAVDGIGLMPALLLLRVVELPDRGMSLDRATVWLIGGGGLLIGFLWLIGMSLLRIWRRRTTPAAGTLWLAGVALSYLLLPLAHHLLATPPSYRYISAASNFFAFSWQLQLLALVVAAALSVATAYGRQWLERRRDDDGSYDQRQFWVR
jgi:hypothetical protein